MGVFLGEDSLECFQDVIKILFDNNYILQEFDDVYIQTKLEMVVLVFFNDIAIHMSLKRPILPFPILSECIHHRTLGVCNCYRGRF